MRTSVTFIFILNFTIINYTEPALDQLYLYTNIMAQSQYNIPYYQLLPFSYIYVHAVNIYTFFARARPSMILARSPGRVRTNSDVSSNGSLLSTTAGAVASVRSAGLPSPSLAHDLLCTRRDRRDKREQSLVKDMATKHMRSLLP